MYELHLDMDGTIANLYHNEDWRIDINTGRTDCYEDAPPFLPRERMRQLIAYAKEDATRMGEPRMRVVVNTWGPEGASEAYLRKVYWAKLLWLAEHIGLDVIDRLAVLPYGTNKVTAIGYQVDQAILVDDSPACRQMFEDSGYQAMEPETMWHFED